MIVQPADRAARPIRPSPVGAELEIPPLAPVAQIDRMLWRREHQRAGLEHVPQRTWIILRFGLDLGEGDVTGSVDEFAEVAVCNRGTVLPEAVYRNAMNRRFFRIMFIRSHAECAAGNPDHSRRAIESRLTACATMLLVREDVHQVVPEIPLAARGWVGNCRNQD